ncbi:MAG: hypothetical protein Q8L48_19640 [Archangium sp.]|nr:hypothetical protein [Archangium sp.]
MSELDPRSLWQDQPTDDLAVHPERSRGGGVDYAVPTTQFGKAPRRAGFGVIGAVAALAAAVVVSVGLALQPPDPVPLQPVVAAADPLDELEPLLAECRTYANPEAGPPDWDRAAAACSRALDLEPLHHEAEALLARIGVLRACEANLEAATALVTAGRLEAALGSLEKLGAGCELYFLRALPVARNVVPEVQRQAASDCKRYASAKKWDVALERCELYSRLACQSADVTPDPLYRSFLTARGNRQPGAAAWQCPRIALFRPPPAAPDPAAGAKGRLAKRYPELALGHALVSYSEGNVGEARVTLQKLIESMAKAAWHETARGLLLDIEEAVALAAKGTTLVQTGKLEQARDAFRQALELDARLMLGTDFVGNSTQRNRALERTPSTLRRAAVELMTQNAYEQGRDLADRKDFRAACRVWKLGNEFSRSSIDLLKALTNVCTRRASEAFERAETCEQLAAARDFAVDGDGFAEKIDATREEEGCR